MDGLSRHERDQLYPGMHKDLIPAYEMVMAKGLGKVGQPEEVRTGGGDPIANTVTSNDKSYSRNSTIEVLEDPDLAQYEGEMLSLIPQALGHRSGLEILGECAMEHFGLTVTGGAVTASGAKTTKKPRKGIAGGGPSGDKTSVASKLLRKVFPRRVIGRFGSVALGKMLARMVPGAGAAILALDALLILRCTIIRIRKER